MPARRKSSTRSHPIWPHHDAANQDRAQALRADVRVNPPSGAGKITLSRQLFERYKNAPAHESIVMSVSMTTRPMRPGEAHGRDYFFVSPAKFHDMVTQNQLLEYARVFETSTARPPRSCATTSPRVDAVRYRLARHAPARR